MPVTLRVTFADGTGRDVRLPAETWIRQASTDVPVVSASPVVRAVLDPDHKLPTATGPTTRSRSGWLPAAVMVITTAAEPIEMPKLDVG